MDLLRFDELAERARTATETESIELYEQAVDCWRGDVLADFPASIRQHPAAIALNARQVAIVLKFADLALESGTYAPIVDRLTKLADSHTFHEGVRARLMLALACAGQQAAALRVFDDIRHRLADELGVEVGAELRDAHMRVLRNDLPASGQSIIEVATQKPAELPADVTGFVGRRDDLERLDGVLSEAMANGGAALRIASIDGMPGVGKTALAVHWAHRVSDRFPDGQLYVNLRGYDRSAPVSPQQAIARFLRALGVPADRVPADEDEAASRYRTLLSGRRILVVLDNARSFEQVRPLLPGTSSCFVVVTSRDRLAELAAAHGTHRISLDALEPADARALVAALIGAERADAERAAVDELARICGCLPLVLRVAAANLSVRAHTSVAEYAAQVSERGRLSDGDAVRAAFDLSYERLKPASRAIFALLGLAPGDLTPDAVAALACCAVPEATDVLRQLCVASLLQEPAACRFRLHDLLRDYAAALASDLPDEVSTAAVTRLMDFYLRSADAAARLLYPNVLRMPLPDSTESLRAVSFASEEAALTWIDSERANLLEAVTRVAELGAPDYAWRLVDALRGYLLTRGYNAEGLAACLAALDAARTERDLRAEASILDVLGLLYYNLSEYERAKQTHTAALERSREVGDRATEAHSLHNLGRVYSQLGKPAEAAQQYEQAIVIRRELGDVVGEAWSLNYVGAACLSRADLAGAFAHSTRALQLCRGFGDRDLEARVLHLTALSHWASGSLDSALETFEEASLTVRVVGNRHIELSVFMCTAEVLCDAGRYREAEEFALRGLALRDLGEQRQLSGCIEILGVVRHREGKVEEAERLFTEALQLASEASFGYGMLSIHLRLASLRRETGRAAEAVDLCRGALAQMRNLGTLLLESKALTELALACAGVGELEEAAGHAFHALELARARGQRLAEANALRAVSAIRPEPGEVDVQAQ